MPPLSEEEREKNLAEMQEEALNTSLPLSDAGDSEEEQDAIEDLEDREKHLLALKEKLLADKQKSKKRLEATKKAKQTFDRIAKLQEEVQSLTGDLQAEIKVIDDMKQDMAPKKKTEQLVPGLSTQPSQQPLEIVGQQPPFQVYSHRRSSSSSPVSVIPV